jgi:hypothetical protein
MLFFRRQEETLSTYTSDNQLAIQSQDMNPVAAYWENNYGLGIFAPLTLLNLGQFFSASASAPPFHSSLL